MSGIATALTAERFQWPASDTQRMFNDMLACGVKIRLGAAI